MMVRQDHNWQPFATKGLLSLLSILWAVLFAVVGWIATSTTTELMQMREQISASQQEIAVLKTQFKFTQEQLDRIEEAVNDIRGQKDRR